MQRRQRCFDHSGPREQQSDKGTLANADHEVVTSVADLAGNGYDSVKEVLPNAFEHHLLAGPGGEGLHEAPTAETILDRGSEVEDANIVHREAGHELSLNQGKIPTPVLLRTAVGKQQYVDNAFRLARGGSRHLGRGNLYPGAELLPQVRDGRPSRNGVGDRLRRDGEGHWTLPIIAFIEELVEGKLPDRKRLVAHLLTVLEVMSREAIAEVACAERL